MIPPDLDLRVIFILVRGFYPPPSSFLDHLKKLKKLFVSFFSPFLIPLIDLAVHCHKVCLLQFIIRTFSSPLKCNHCTSLMIGLTRQVNKTIINIYLSAIYLSIYLSKVQPLYQSPDWTNKTGTQNNNKYISIS